MGRSTEYARRLATIGLLSSSCHLVLGFEDHEVDPNGHGGDLAAGGADAGGGGGGADATGGGGTGGDGGGGGCGVPSFGEQQTVAEGQAQPHEIGLDAGDVYWVNAGANESTGQLARRAKDGSGRVAIVESPIEDAIGIGLSGARVFWIGSATSYTYLWSKAKDGTGTATSLFPFGNGQSFFGYMAVQGPTIAWATKGSLAKNLPPRIYRGASDGTGKLQLWEGTQSQQARGLALDGVTVYWVAYDLDGVYRSNGTTAELVAEDAGGPSAVTLDMGHAYFTTDVGAVKRRPKDGTGTTEVLVDDAVAPRRIAIDGDTVYWVEGGATGRVRAVSKCGGEAVDVAIDGGPFDVVADGASVYISLADAGSVVRVPKN